MKVGIGELYSAPANIKSETTDDDNKKPRFSQTTSPVCSQRNQKGTYPCHITKLSQQMLDLEVRNEDIKQIKKLNSNKSPGPDGIHPKFIYKKT